MDNVCLVSSIYTVDLEENMAQSVTTTYGKRDLRQELTIARKSWKCHGLAPETAMKVAVGI